LGNGKGASGVLPSGPPSGTCKVPPAPAGVVATPGGKQVVLSWNTAPGATSYYVKRSTSSGGETTIANVSATANNWPASNEYTDTGLTSGTKYGISYG